MECIYDLSQWKNIRTNVLSDGITGFIPTMGNLHLGHASLIQNSLQDNKYTVVSIFVNPTQFNQPQDLKNYPRTLEDDISYLEKLGVDYCLIPNTENIYADNYCFKLLETEFSSLMEGKHRPGHFNGVLTVVMKLLNLVRPHRAYFGEKDYQQYKLISDMVRAFFMDTEIIACPTIRESSGLAYSSRNSLLSSSKKIKAEQFVKVFLQKDKTSEQIKQSLLELDIEVEYVEAYLNRRFAAVKIGGVRLIDNYVID